MGIFAHICRQGGCEVRPVFQLFWDSHGGYRKELSVGCDLQRETSSKRLRSWVSCKWLTDWPNTSPFWSSYMIIKLLYRNPMAWKHGQFQIGTKTMQKSSSVWYSRSYNFGFPDFWWKGMSGIHKKCQVSHHWDGIASGWKWLKKTKKRQFHKAFDLDLWCARPSGRSVLFLCPRLAFWSEARPAAGGALEELRVGPVLVFEFMFSLNHCRLCHI